MSIATEDYLKRILAAEERSGDNLVGLGALADAMQVTPGTITTMVKSLERAGLVTYYPRSGVRLTGRGRKQAMGVLRRHRLIELFLVESLGFDWSEVHDEAEVLEHAVSARLLERIDATLGHPEFDPHGDPIPSATGSILAQDTVELTSAPINNQVTIARVHHHDPEFLSYLKEQGLVPGAQVVVLDLSDQADTVRVRANAHESVLSRAAATGIRVLV